MKPKLRQLFLTISLLLSFSIAHAQDLGLSKYNSFIQKNFPEFLAYFGVQDLASFKTDNIAVGTSVIDTKTNFVTTRNYSREEWKTFLKDYEPFLLFNNNKKYFVDLISGNIWIEYKNGVYQGAMELPERLNFGISARKATYSLGSLGTQGEYSEAMWVNKNTFIVAGYYWHYHPFDDNFRHGFIPFFKIYEFKSAKRYKSLEYIGTPMVEERANYEGKLFRQIDFQ